MKKGKAILIIVIVGFIVYLKSFFNGFAWDDGPYILQNEFHQSIKYFFLFFSQPCGILAGKWCYPMFYRPIRDVYVALIFSLFGPNPFFFHFFQFIIHIINSVLVYFIFNKFFDKQKYLPLFLSLIFVVHPINTETVVWISAAQEILVGLCGLSALFLILKPVNISNKNILIASFLIFISLFIKETGVVFFAIIFVYLFLFNKKIMLVFNTFYSTILIFLYMLARILSNSSFNVIMPTIPIAQLTLIQRLFTLPKIFFFYMSNFIFPKDLAIDQLWVVKTPDFNNFVVPLIFLIAFVSVSLIISIKTKNKVFIFFFLLIFISMAPYFNIVPTSMTVAERWFYIPIIGLLGMIGFLINKINVKRESVFNTIFIVIILLFGIRAFIRTLDWKDNFKLFTTDVKISKDSSALESNVGLVLMNKGDLEGGYKHIIRSLELSPHKPNSLTNLGDYYEKKGNLKKAEDVYLGILKRNPEFYPVYPRYASILIKLDRKKEAKKFLENKALKYFFNDPVLLDLYKNLINI
jgi:hypothetical protein